MIWKKKAGKNLQAQVVKELMANLKAAIERGDDPPIGRTEKQVTGFRGRSGRSFRAKLRVEPWTRDDDSRAWRVEFDEDWANQPRATPPAEGDGEGDAKSAKEAVGEAEALASGGDAGSGDAEAKLEPERA